jgi:hypothetical protein
VASSKEFYIHSDFTDPVPAGTAVWFEARSRKFPGAALTTNFALSWEIEGPFPGDVVRDAGEPSPGNEAVFELDTSRMRPASYKITSTRKRRVSDGGDTEGGDAVGLTEPVTTAAAGTGMPPASRTELPVAERTDGPVAAVLPADSDVAVWTMQIMPAVGSANREGVVPVSLQRTSTVPTSDQILWMIIRNRTDAISFPRFKKFVDGVMCGKTPLNGETDEPLRYRGTGAYDLLVRATDVFLMQEMGVVTDSMIHPVASLSGDVTGPAWAELGALSDEQLALRERSRLGFAPLKVEIDSWRKDYFQQLRDESVTVLPYLNIIQEKLSDIPLKSAQELPPNCYGILRSRVSEPLAIELIWSYWHEEGMLVQTLHAILARFQNRKIRSGPDPLARLDIDPLRPLGNLIWGWAQDEFGRLTVARRSAEYEHEYGLRLAGRALPPEVQTVDRRRHFLEAFHNLLYLAHVFFGQDDDTTVIADGFPVLNGLREGHHVLAEGAHNQYGDLPSTARAEFLVMAWLLSRPEMREFLGGRIMVPYQETWMDRVDTMKTMQRWSDVSITHFRDLAVFGEQILLSIRFGNWSVVNDPQQAANWARYWRPEIQRYVHAYRAATGVDLTERADSTLPTVLLQRRMTTAHRGA